MRKCDDCKIILEDSVEFCPKCGKAISGSAGAVPDSGTGPLLASANLHRIRGELDAAAEDAAKAFQQDPNDPEIASLLAAIFEDRSDLAEAAVWYQVAVDLAPEMLLYKTRLERVNRQMQAAKDGLPALRRFLKQRWVLAVGALLAAYLIVMLIGAIGGRSPSQNRAPIDSTRRPVRIADLGKHPEPAAQSGGISLSGVPYAGSQPGPAPQSRGTATESLRTPAELAIKASLLESERISGIGASIDDVIADPRRSSIEVTFALSDSRNVNREKVLTASFHIARGAFAANNEARSITVRCVVSGGGATQIAFVGDAARQTIEMLPERPSMQDLTPAFANPWWNPLIQ